MYHKLPGGQYPKVQHPGVQGLTRVVNRFRGAEATRRRDDEMAMQPDSHVKMQRSLILDADPKKVRLGHDRHHSVRAANR